LREDRGFDQLRKISFIRNFTNNPAGSVLVSFGETKVLCTASVDMDTPKWLRGSDSGWITAEYSLLPGSSTERVSREATKGKQSGRTMEIQRLIARSLRSIADLSKIKEIQIILDCDVLQADGGTRTASICGSYVALVDAIDRLLKEGKINDNPIFGDLAAISVGICDGQPLLDLDYNEDSNAEVDMNVVMSKGKFVEIQGTAEREPFDYDQLNEMLNLAQKGIKEIVQIQKNSLGS
jgi:ribonuclease PH